MTPRLFPAFPLLALLLPAYGGGREGVAMHVVIALFYGTILWLSLLAYFMIVRLDWWYPLALAPVLISGFAGFLLLLDHGVLLACGFARWLWLSLATFRPWRSEA